MNKKKPLTKRFAVPYITLLTDFGDSDGYVAAMKGVIAMHAPGVPVIDAGHHIAPQDLVGAALALSRYWRFFPRYTVHVVVVDPGVGTPRQAVLAIADDHIFAVPDNGILTEVARSASSFEAFVIRPSVHNLHAYSSHTFHGRDIFAFAAAKVASRKVNFNRLAEPAASLSPPLWPEPRRVENGWVGEVIHADHFGNLITNLTKSHLAFAPPGAGIWWQEQEIPFVRIYADVPPGQLLALLNSDGRLEIACRNGAAGREAGGKVFFGVEDRPGAR